MQSLNIRNRIFAFVVILSITGLFCLINFYGILHQKPFSDDWMMLEIARELHNKPWTDWLLVKDHFNQWRPLPFILKGFYLNGMHRDLVFYNSFKLLILLSIIVAIYFTSKSILNDQTVSLLAAGLFLFNPTNIGAIQNIDHIYKLTGALFFGLSVFMFYGFVERRRSIYFLFFFLFYLAGFLSDADAVAVFPAVILILVFHFKNIGMKRAVGISMACLFILGIYIYIRGLVVGGALSGGVSGQQDIVLDATILFNILRMLASNIIFTVSPYIFLGERTYILLGAFFAVLNTVVISIAFIKAPMEQKKILILLIGLSLIAMVPFILIRHVSEIYTIKSACFLMIVLAYSMIYLLRQSKGMLRSSIIMYILVLLLSGAYSIRVKQEMMLKRGLMAENMAKSMKSLLPSPPEYSTINLTINACGVTKTYSDFINDDYLLAQLDKRYDYFVRYNYADSTLNTINNPSQIYHLKWDCDKKEFSLVSN